MHLHVLLYVDMDMLRRSIKIDHLEAPYPILTLHIE